MTDVVLAADTVFHIGTIGTCIGGLKCHSKKDESHQEWDSQAGHDVCVSQSGVYWPEDRRSDT